MTTLRDVDSWDHIPQKHSPRRWSGHVFAPTVQALDELKNYVTQGPIQHTRFRFDEP